MAIDPLEVGRMEVRDFGDQVTVTTVDGVVFSRAMIFEEESDEVSLGTLAGVVGEQVFFCLPEDDALIGEGDLITRADGTEYQVLSEPSRKAGQLTEIRVDEL